MVDYDEVPSLIKGGIGLLTQDAAAERSRKRIERILAMKALCPDIWRQRGQAHIIAERWRKNGGEPVSERTIRRYMKD